MVKPYLIALLLCCATLAASDVRLELPGHLAPGVATAGLVVVSDAPSAVKQIAFPELPGVGWTLTGNAMTMNSI